jgi:hypothetical protein
MLPGLWSNAARWGPRIGGIKHRKEENPMPKVGKKSFPYTAKGKAMAKAEAKKTGKKVAMKKGYK